MERKSHPDSFYSVMMDHNIFHKYPDFASAAYRRGRNLEIDIQHHPVHSATNQLSPCGHTCMRSLLSHTICHFCVCQVNHSVS